MGNKITYVELGDVVIRTTTPEFHPSGKVLPKAEGERRYKEEATKNLLKLFAQTTTAWKARRRDRQRVRHGHGL